MNNKNYKINMYTCASNYIITTCGVMSIKRKGNPQVFCRLLSLLFQLRVEKHGHTSSSPAESSQPPHPPPSKRAQEITLPASDRFLPNPRHLSEAVGTWEACPAVPRVTRRVVSPRVAKLLHLLSPPSPPRAPWCSPSVACRAACIAASVRNP